MWELELLEARGQLHAGYERHAELARLFARHQQPVHAVVICESEHRNACVMHRSNQLGNR